MNRVSLLIVVSAGLAFPAFAQHAGHDMPAKSATTEAPTPEPRQPVVVPSDQHNHTLAPVAEAPDPHAGHVMDQPAIEPLDVGNDIPPDAPVDHAADAVFPRKDMQRARRILADEHGGAPQSMIMANLLEYQSRNGEGGYRWEGEGWFGGDINRLVVKSEGEGGRGGVEAGEIQALYSRAVGPYTDFQVGVRHDFDPDPSRNFLAVGFETLLPYRFETQGALFVGERGQVLGRLEGTHDFLLTQRIALQPRAELNFATRNDPATGTGSGLSDAELGLRLRYEIRREFAPYIGVSWERSFGDTASFARLEGERVERTSIVAGLRAWY